MCTNAPSVHTASLPPRNLTMYCIPSQVDCMSTVRVLVAKDLRSVDARKDVIKRVGEVVVRLMDKSGCVPALDPTQDMKVGRRGQVKVGGESG